MPGALLPEAQQRGPALLPEAQPCSQRPSLAPRGPALLPGKRLPQYNTGASSYYDDNDCTASKPREERFSRSVRNASCCLAGSEYARPPVNTGFLVTQHSNVDIHKSRERGNYTHMTHDIAAAI